MNELKNDEVAWIEHRILADIARLRELQPSHLLVTTVRVVFQYRQSDPHQYELDLKPDCALMKHQAE